MGLLGSLRGKQGGDAIRQSTTTATMHLLEQNRKFEAFMRDKVATLERQVAEDDGRLNRSDGDEEGDLVDEAGLAADLGAEGPDEGQAAGAGLPARTEPEGVAVIGQDTGEPDEESEQPTAPAPTRLTVAVPSPPPPAPSPKAASAPPDWRAFLKNASSTTAPQSPAAEMEEPAAGEGDQVGDQGEDVDEEETPAVVEASEPAAGEGDQVDAQGEDVVEEETPAEVEAGAPAAGEGDDQVDAQEEDEEGHDGDLFAMDLPITSVTSVVAVQRQSPATEPSVAAAPPAAAKASSPASSAQAAPAPDADGSSAGEWEQGDLHQGQAGAWT
jgi:hypothetical protein